METYAEREGERNRRENNREKLLRLLSDRNEHTNVELVAVAGMRFGGRLYELRHEGYEVEMRHVEAGLYTYRLIRTPEDGIPPLDQNGQALLGF